MPQQNSASEKVAEAVGNALVWLFDHVTVNIILVIIGAMIVGYLLWQLSVTFGPMKLCWRCKGKGYRNGIFGGKRVCTRCKSGLQPRAGSRR